MTEAAAPVAEAPKPAPAAEPPGPAADAPKPGEAQPEAKPERQFTQKELDEIVERRLAKERRKREDIERRLKITEELHLKAREPEKPAPAPKGDAEPVRGDFGTYEEFLEARAEWRADKKVDQRFDKDRAERDRREREEKATQERDAFRKSMKDSAKDIEDFDETMAELSGDPEHPAGRIWSPAVEAADAPGKVLHYLVKNPEEAERIASLPMGKQAREIVRLEEKLSKPPVKPSKAPDPIKPVGGKTTAADEMPDAAKDPDKWWKWRQAQIASRKRPGASA